MTTGPVSDITQTSAICGGNITSDGGAAITSRGICWSTSQNPTTADSIGTNGTGLGSYSISLAGLSANTTYYARAFVKANSSTGYANEISFKTRR